MLKAIFKTINTLYPASFRREFQEEILADLADRETEINQAGLLKKIRLISREIAGWLRSIPREQVSEMKLRLQRLICSQSYSLKLESEGLMTTKQGQVENWSIQDRKTALIASLPPLLFGSAVWLTWRIIGGPWYTASEMQLKAGLYAGLALGAVIAVGGIIALIKRFPTWGYVWLGSSILGVLMLIKSLVEEQPDLLPEWAGTAIGLLLLALSAIVIFRAVYESWQAAGLVSIGMSTTMALANFHMVAIGPYHRPDLVILGLLSGLIFTALTYAFTRSSLGKQIGILCLIGLLNLGTLYLANQVWTSHLDEIGKDSPFIPMLVLLVILLAAGPLAGMFRKPMHTYIDGKK